MTEPTILYVAGLAHSGSTYLSRVLNQHPQIFAGGEILDIHEQFQKETVGCACNLAEDGTSLEVQCPFWSEIRKKCENLPWPLKEIARLSHDRRLEWMKALLGSYERNGETSFGEKNLELFRLIGWRANSPIIVDDSKTLWRLLPMDRTIPERVRILHLLKQPENQVHSRKKRGYNFYHSAIMKYLRKNALYWYLFAESDRYQKLRFEEFVQDPEDQLARVFDWLGIETINPFEVEGQSYHHLSGGKPRRSGTLEKPDPDRLSEAHEYSKLQQILLNTLRYFY